MSTANKCYVRKASRKCRPEVVRIRVRRERNRGALLRPNAYRFCAVITFSSSIPPLESPAERFADRDLVTLADRARSRKMKRGVYWTRTRSFVASSQISLGDPYGRALRGCDVLDERRDEDSKRAGGSGQEPMAVG